MWLDTMYCLHLFSEPLHKGSRAWSLSWGLRREAETNPGQVPTLEHLKSTKNGPTTNPRFEPGTFILWGNRIQNPVFFCVFSSELFIFLYSCIWFSSLHLHPTIYNQKRFSFYPFLSFMQENVKLCKIKFIATRKIQI